MRNIILSLSIIFLITSCGEDCIDASEFRDISESELIQQNPVQILRYKIKGEYFTGNKCYKGNIVHRYKDGYLVERMGYDSHTNQVTEKGLYDKGVLISDSTFRYDNDGNRYIFEYRHYSTDGSNQLKNGDWVTYFENTSLEDESVFDRLREKGSYKEDEKIGVWERYHSNGVKFEMDTYGENGERNGVYKRWNEDGTIKEVIVYNDGDISDEWVWKGYNGKNYWIKNRENGEYTYIELKGDGSLDLSLSKVPATEGKYVFSNFSKESMKDFDINQ